MKIEFGVFQFRKKLLEFLRELIIHNDVLQNLWNKIVKTAVLGNKMKESKGLEYLDIPTKEKIGQHLFQNHDNEQKLFNIEFWQEIFTKIAEGIKEKQQRKDEKKRKIGIEKGPQQFRFGHRINNQDKFTPTG